MLHINFKIFDYHIQCYTKILKCLTTIFNMLHINFKIFDYLNVTHRFLDFKIFDYHIQCYFKKNCIIKS